MDNAQKVIMVGVGLFITIVIISVVLVITNLGQGVTDNSTEIISGTSSDLKEKLFLRYINKELSSNELDVFVSSYGKEVNIRVRMNGRTKACNSSEHLKDLGISSKIKYTCTYNKNTKTVMVKSEEDLTKYNGRYKLCTKAEAINAIDIIWGTTTYFKILSSTDESLTGTSYRNDYKNLVQKDINAIFNTANSWNIKRGRTKDIKAYIQFQAVN